MKYGKEVFTDVSKMQLEDYCVVKSSNGTPYEGIVKMIGRKNIRIEVNGFYGRHELKFEKSMIVKFVKPEWNEMIVLKK